MNQHLHPIILSLRHVGRGNGQLDITGKVQSGGHIGTVGNGRVVLLSGTCDGKHSRTNGIQEIDDHLQVRDVSALGQ